MILEQRPPKGVVDEIGGKRQMGRRVSFCQLVFDLDKNMSDSYLGILTTTFIRSVAINISPIVSAGETSSCPENQE